MMQALDFFGFLMLGLLGGFGHCVGMCSPFVLVVSRSSAARGTSPAIAQLWYTTGRLLTYAALGAIAGALGSVIELAGTLIGIQRAAIVIGGIVLVTWSLGSLSALGRRLQDRGAWFAVVAGRMRSYVPSHPLAVGLVLGLLPCGLLYSAVIAAVAVGGALAGATSLAIFGLGTAVALLAISLADELLVRHRPAFNRLSQVFVLVMGVWFLWRGIVG